MVADMTSQSHFLVTSGFTLVAILLFFAVLAWLDRQISKAYTENTHE